MPDPSSERLIICFGDSLTAGYQSPTATNPMAEPTPYGLVLQERLGSAAQVRVSGICGEVTGEMVLRFRADVLARHPQVVVILGGTNDLGWNADPAEILRNLTNMYELARAASILPVPVTVPSIRVEEAERDHDASSWVAEHINRRQRLNAMIAQYAERKKLRYLDLFAATAEPDSLQLAAPYSNDGLHLTTEGYRLFGSLLYERIFAPTVSGSVGA
jgi:lysophospholipase L1-like esterase